MSINNRHFVTIQTEPCYRWVTPPDPIALSRWSRQHEVNADERTEGVIPSCRRKINERICVYTCGDRGICECHHWHRIRTRTSGDRMSLATRDLSSECNVRTWKRWVHRLRRRWIRRLESSRRSSSTSARSELKAERQKQQVERVIALSDPGCNIFRRSSNGTRGCACRRTLRANERRIFQEEFLSRKKDRKRQKRD